MNPFGKNINIKRRNDEPTEKEIFLEIIQIVKENIDPNFKFSIVSGRPGDPAKIIADCTLARQSIGWNPDLSIKQMVVSGWEAWENEKLLL